ncbi:MAG: murein hydrolase activator EnvC family protein [Candidatus Nanopelagicales bacterium]
MKAVIRKLFVFILSLSLVFTINSPIYALPKNIDDEVNAAQQELENASALVREVAAELAEIRKKLPIAEAALKKARAELAVAQEKDRQAAEKLAELESQLEITQKTYDQTRSFVADVARTIYQEGPLATLEIILGATDPNDFSQKLMAMQTYIGNQNAKIEQLETIKAQLETEQAAVAAQKVILEQEKAAALEAAKRAKAAEEEVLRLIAKQKAALAKAESEREATRKRYEQLRAEQIRLQQLARLRAGLGGSIPGELYWPVQGARLSQNVGPRRHPVFGYRSCHTGMDLAAGTGTPIGAAATGIVTAVTTLRAYGRVIVIAHNGGLSTMYAHLSRFNVSVGQGVAVGDTIGFVGSSGWSTGPHLHFEVHVNGTPFNPLGWFGSAKVPVSC